MGSCATAPTTKEPLETNLLLDKPILRLACRRHASPRWLSYRSKRQTLPFNHHRVPSRALAAKPAAVGNQTAVVAPKLSVRASPPDSALETDSRGRVSARVLLKSGPTLVVARYLPGEPEAGQSNWNLLEVGRLDRTERIPSKGSPRSGRYSRARFLPIVPIETPFLTIARPTAGGDETKRCQELQTLKECHCFSNLPGRLIGTVVVRNSRGTSSGRPMGLQAKYAAFHV